MSASASLPPLDARPLNEPPFEAKGADEPHADEPAGPPPHARPQPRFQSQPQPRPEPRSQARPQSRPQSRPKPRVGRDFVAHLARAIAEGRFAPGTTLPREQDLCEEFGLSRTVVREALKTLESKSVVRSRPRAGTLVRERDAWNLLDAELLDWMGERVVDTALLASVLEARRAVEPFAAELAAARASLADLAALEGAWTAMRDAAPGDDAAFTAADAEFHRALLRASGNRVFVQLSGVIDAALTRALDRANRSVASHERAVAVHGRLVEALRLRDAPQARAASEAILETAAHDLRNLA